MLARGELGVDGLLLCGEAEHAELLPNLAPYAPAERRTKPPAPVSSPQCNATRGRTRRVARDGAVDDGRPWRSDAWSARRRSLRALSYSSRFPLFHTTSRAPPLSLSPPSAAPPTCIFRGRGLVHYNLFLVSLLLVLFLDFALNFNTEGTKVFPKVARAGGTVAACNVHSPGLLDRVSFILNLSS